MPLLLQRHSLKILRLVVVVEPTKPVHHNVRGDFVHLLAGRSLVKVLPLSPLITQQLTHDFAGPVYNIVIGGLECHFEESLVALLVTLQGVLVQPVFDDQPFLLLL